MGRRHRTAAVCLRRRGFGRHCLWYFLERGGCAGVGRPGRRVVAYACRGGGRRVCGGRACMTLVLVRPTRHRAMRPCGSTAACLWEPETGFGGVREGLHRRSRGGSWHTLVWLGMRQGFPLLDKHYWSLHACRPPRSLRNPNPACGQGTVSARQAAWSPAARVRRPGGAAPGDAARATRRRAPGCPGHRCEAEGRCSTDAPASIASICPREWRAITCGRLWLLQATHDPAQREAQRT